MSINNRILPVILCGGTGSRLWPLSRRSLPKQYLSINPEQNLSFLQITIERINNLKFFANPIVICNDEHRFITAEQLREINISPASILLEPSSRNTAPAIACAALKAISQGEDPTLLILPSDHHIKDKKAFLNSIEIARNSADNGKIATFGVKPNYPATGYGYIKRKGQTNDLLEPIKIEKFIEKPNLSLAEKIFKNKDYSWNSGIYMAKASVLISELKTFSPEIMFYCKKSIDKMVDDLDFERINKDSFAKCTSKSIDKAVMEKTELGVVTPLQSEWTDIGCWESFWENSPKDKNKNVLIGDSLEISSNNSLIISESRLTVGLGIKDLIVIETNDAVLVANKNQSENVKSLVSLLKSDKRLEGEENRKVFRPWGNYFSLDYSSRWKIKRIEVNPGSSLSLQLHKKRSEHWIVVEGTAKVQIDNKEFFLETNQSCFVPISSKHRLSNPKEVPLIIIEVQIGEYLGEDDIIRFEDKYGRTL